jgi:hypothetical protein
MLWITSSLPAQRRRLLLQVLAAFLLGLSLTACGSKRSMESARSDDELGSVHEDGATKLQGQEEVNFDEAAERHRRVAGIKGGNTRSGPGKLNQITTKAGDTLWKISERKDVYGSGWLYPLIYKANKDKIKDPSNLPAGLVLTIPRDVPDPEVEIAKEEAMTGQYLDKSAPKPTPVAPLPVKAPHAGGLGWFWVLLLLAAAGAGAWWWKKRQASASPPPAAPPAAPPVPPAGPPPLRKL